MAIQPEKHRHRPPDPPDDNPTELTISAARRDYLLLAMVSLLRTLTVSSAVRQFNRQFFTASEIFVAEAQKLLSDQDAKAELAEQVAQLHISELDFTLDNGPPLTEDQWPESIKKCRTHSIVMHNSTMTNAYPMLRLCLHSYCPKGCGAMKQNHAGQVMLEQFHQCILKEGKIIYYFVCTGDEWVRVAKLFRSEDYKTAEYYCVHRRTDGDKFVFTDTPIFLEQRRSRKSGRVLPRIKAIPLDPNEFVQKITWAIRLPEKRREDGRDVDISVKRNGSWANPNRQRGKGNEKWEVLSCPDLPPERPREIFKEEAATGAPDHEKRATIRCKDEQQKAWNEHHGISDFDNG